MQCKETPWQEYYASGEIKFIKAPTEKELAIVYYANKHNVEIKSFEKIEENKIVCQACDVCPAGYHYLITVSSKDLEKMKELGWKLYG
jgi:hypothetical protein